MPKLLPSLTAGFAALLAALALGVSSAAAGSTPCWKTLLNDYFRDGRIDNTYQLKCYNQALAHLDEDTVIYGSAVRDIHRALLSAEFGYRKKHPHSGAPGPNSLLPPPPGGSGGGGSGGGGHHPRNFFQKLADAIGPGNATSIPLPLLILAGIGLLLVLAAGGSYAARWIQARRMRPQPATAPPTPRRK
jgi:hypothetical protein